MFPVRDTIPVQKFPWANWTIIVLNGLFFMVELALPDRELEQFFYVFGLVPARYYHPDWAAFYGLHADDYWPFITNMFLHGGWLHFIGNMWTLYIFGDNVEDRMGAWRYLLFYVLSGLAAGITHSYLHPDSIVPAIGASGAISGVMAAYMFLYPRGRIVFLMPLWFFPFFFELPAFVYLLFWFFGQLFSGTLSLMVGSGATGIAFWAHIGGFAAGILLYAFFIPSPPDRHERSTYL